MRFWYLILGAAAIFVATTGFECASSEMTAAKVDFNAKRFDKARTSLEAEVRKNPKNEEAWYYLALTAHEQHDYSRVAEACDSAELAGSQYKLKIIALRQNEWVETWNRAVTLYNNAGDNKDSLQHAATLFSIVYRLDPADAEPIRLLGGTYLSIGDTSKALEAYLKYIATNDDNVKRGLDAGLVIGEPADQIIKDLGKPDIEKVMPTVDSAHLLIYKDKTLHLFVAAPMGEPNAARLLTGWKYTTVITKDGNERVERMTAEPYRMVGNIYYQRGIAMLRAFDARPTADSAGYRSGVEVMNKAIGYFSTAQRMSPSDEFASTMLSEIYLRTNQLNKAVAAYQDLIKKFPTNKYTRLNYGVLLLKGNSYEDAAKQFENALQIDAAYRLAQYYLAITYKNWSADMQAAVRKSGVKETAEEKEKYLAKLRKAAVYFDQMHQGDASDYAPLGQLAEIYAILKDADKLKTTLALLEGMESAQSGSAEYWDTLGKIYSVLNDVPKAKAAFAKSEALLRR